MMGSVSLSIESSELTDSQRGIGHLGVNGLPGVSGLFVGVGVQNGDGHGISFGSRSES